MKMKYTKMSSTKSESKIHSEQTSVDLKCSKIWCDVVVIVTDANMILEY